MTERDCAGEPGGAFPGTPFHAGTEPRTLSPWWFGWGVYVVPDVYTDPFDELRAIRTGVSMNEMSPIPKIEVRGPDARACVDHLITRDASRMDVGCAWYTPWCTEDGKVVADGIVFCFERDRFVFSGDRCETFLREQSGGFDAEIGDVTDDHGILALQGPRSRAVLEAVTGESWVDGLVPAALAGLGTELTVQWADFWGRPLGTAAAQVCEYPFIDLSRQK